MSLCWAQINFRRKLYKAGYTAEDLLYKTPGSPYTGIVAIVLMILCLGFLLMNPDATYKIAFGFGVVCFVVPMLVYQWLGLHKKREAILTANQHVRFSDVFPEK